MGIEDMEPKSDEGRPNFGSSLDHYTEALRLYLGFVSETLPDVLGSHREVNSELSVPINAISVTEANQLLPVEGYLCFYCDLLGFSAEMTESGTGSLPDFYGTALVSAAENPSINVYLFSDTCVAFAPSCEGSSFLNFVSVIFSRWLDDGMVPQGFVGYGSFVERKPDLGPPPRNFLGTQIAGTALVDAANVQKTKPLGSRILVTQSAFDNLPRNHSARMVLDKKGDIELLPERGLQFDLLDCLYYLQVLRTLSPGTRVFDHYTWSYASRVIRSRRWISEIAQEITKSDYSDYDIDKIISAVDDVLHAYQDL